jgi:hypothetical protein
MAGDMTNFTVTTYAINKPHSFTAVVFTLDLS